MCWRVYADLAKCQRFLQVVQVRWKVNSCWLRMLSVFILPGRALTCVNMCIIDDSCKENATALWICLTQTLPINYFVLSWYRLSQCCCALRTVGRETNSSVVTAFGVRGVNNVDSFLSTNCSHFLSSVKIYYSFASFVIRARSINGNWPEGFQRLANCISNQCQDSAKNLCKPCMQYHGYRDWIESARK